MMSPNLSSVLPVRNVAVVENSTLAAKYITKQDIISNSNDLLPKCLNNESR